MPADSLHKWTWKACAWCSMCLQWECLFLKFPAERVYTIEAGSLQSAIYSQLECV